MTASSVKVTAGEEFQLQSIEIETKKEIAILTYIRRHLTSVTVVEQIMSANDSLAAQNQAQLEANGVLGMNVMASPGSGKTSVILRTIEAVAASLKLGVIEGDTAAVTIDADKVISAGMPAVQINTGGQCHVDAVMIGNALPQLPLAEIDLLIVENVGNLICPAAFHVGNPFQHRHRQRARRG